MAILSIIFNNVINYDIACLITVFLNYCNTNNIVYKRKQIKNIYTNQNADNFVHTVLHLL